MKKLIIILLPIFMLYSCFDSEDDKTQVKDNDQGVITSSIKYKVFSPNTDVKFHDSGYIAVYKSKSTEDGCFTYESYDLDNNLLFRKEIGNKKSGIVRFTALTSSGTAFISAEENLIYTHYKISKDGNLLWQDSCNVERWGPWNILTGENEEFILSEYDTIAILFNHVMSSVDTFHVKGDHSAFPVTVVDNNPILSTWNWDSGNFNLLMLDANSDTVWHKKMDSVIIKPYIYRITEDIIYAIGAKDLVSTLYKIDIRNGNVINQTILNTIITNFYTGLEIKSDGSFLVIGSSWNIADDQPGKCLIHKFSEEGKEVEDLVLGDKNILYRIHDCLPLGDDSYLFSARVRAEESDHHVVFKSNLDDVYYLDSIDFSDYKSDSRSCSSEFLPLDCFQHGVKFK